MTEDVSADVPTEVPPEVRERPSLRRGIIDDWWLFAVRGAVAILFGLTARVWPEITQLALSFLIVAYALV